MASRESYEEQRSTEAQVNLDLIPDVGARSAVRLELDAPKSVRSSVLQGPVPLWIPKSRLEVGGAAGAGRMNYIGPMSMLVKANKPPQMRTAHFIISQPKSENRRAVLALAALRSVAMRRRDLATACDNLGRPLLYMLSLRTDLELWVNSAKKVLPAEKPKFAFEALEAADVVGFVEAWTHDIGRTLLAARVQPVPSKRPTHRRLGEFNATFGDVQDVVILDVPGTPEWHAVSAEQLYDLVWKFPLETLGQRFGTTRKSVAKKCDLLSVQRPPEGYWKLVELGLDATEMLRRSGVRPPKPD